MKNKSRKTYIFLTPSGVSGRGDVAGPSFNVNFGTDDERSKLSLDEILSTSSNNEFAAKAR